jgi:thioesterase domain-containing protein
MLAGYSFGGVLAFEVAHQLQREGIPVELILMLDSWAATPPMWQKLRVLSMDRGSSRDPRRNPLWSVMRTRIPKRVARLAFAKSSDISIRPAEAADILFGEVTPIVFQKLLRGIRKAYRYSRLDCGAVLFRCQEDAYSTHTLRGKMGWDGLFTRKLEIIETPGNHASLLREPHLQALARRIDDRLAQLSQQQRDEATANLQPMQRQA